MPCEAMLWKNALRQGQFTRFSDPAPSNTAVSITLTLNLQYSGALYVDEDVVGDGEIRRLLRFSSLF